MFYKHIQHNDEVMRQLTSFKINKAIEEADFAPVASTVKLCCVDAEELRRRSVRQREETHK